MADSAREPASDNIWVSALRATAEVARKAASHEQDVIRAVTEELRRLRLRGSVALLTPNRQLEVHTPSLSQSLMSTLRRLTGLEVAGYRFDPQAVDIYRAALETGEAQFTADRAQVVGQMLPPNLRPMLSRLMRLLGQDNVIIAPLILEDEPIGTINVTARWLSPDDLPHVAALADHIAIALGHVRSRQRLEQALALQHLRNQVAEVVSSALELPVVLERVIHIATEVIGAEAGAIGLIDPGGQVATYPYIYGLPDELRQQSALRGHGLIWPLVEERKPILIPRYADHPMALSNWVRAGVKAFLGVPLIVGNDAIGGMELFSLSRDASFTQEHVEQAQAIASMAAIALQNARLYSHARRRAEESLSLMQTARAISSLLDTDTVLQEIARQANDLLHADGSRIHLLDYETGELRCVVALEPNAEAIKAFRLKVGQGLTGHVVEHGEPLLINDPASDPRGIQVPGTPDGEPECLAIVPLSIRQRTLGAMTVRRLGTDRPFTAEEMNLLKAYAAQAAVSIENAHLYGQIQAQAQRLEVQVAERTRELSLSEARYRSLVETAQAGILQLDKEGTILYVNQQFSEMLGLPSGELLGKHFTDVGALSVQDAAEMLSRFRERISGRLEPQDVYELNLKTQDGRTLHTLVGISLFTDEAGAPQGMTALITDISDRIALENALRAERDRLDALLTHVGDAVMVTDSDGSIQFVNPAWERLNGYAADEVLGRQPWFLDNRGGEHSPPEEMIEAFRGSEIWKGEVVNRRKDGSTYEAAVTITPVLGPEGEPLNYVAVLHDISALKEIDRLKTQFVSDVSHELRTPLTNIRLYLDLLARVDDRERINRYLETLSRESDRLANLIDDLLSLSRLDVGASPLEPAPVDVNRILQSLAKDRASLAANKGLQLHLEIQDDLPKLTGDERLLGQVFTNLLTNAMNYTPRGGEITLRSRLQTEADERWIIAEVEDTGLGIPQQEQADIFKRFFRGEASHRTGAPGTGLGLAICQEITARHGGRIELHSEGIPGKGSCFSVWLPLTSANGDAETSADAPLKKLPKR